MESELIKPRTRLGIFGLIRESFKTIKRNGKQMLPLLLLVFLFFCQLHFAQIYLLKPVGKDFASQLAQYPNLFQDFGNNMHQTEYSDALDDIREFLLVKIFILTFSSIIYLVFLIAAVFSLSEGKVQSLSEMMMKIKQSWKRPIMTSFYMILLIIGFIYLCTVSVVMVYILDVGSWAYLFYGVVVLIMVILLIYFSALWTMSLVVSVIEDVSGLDAISRGRELLKGEKVKGSLVLVLLYIAYGLIQLMMNAVISPNLEQWSQTVMSIVLSNVVLCGFNLFVFVVFTVFYNEQKESCDEKAAGKKLNYLPLFDDEV
ncbi:hypothetical protein QVD17_00523 [Tagetes erecta]|uniref:Transmembrane protein n=1 Tax=Tagetes erecta TaxID=13708 RepID=A0AAD8LAC8_TARER|nr:hypothetical protein QVD17_00523 [Tagetes erecta]